MNHPPDVFQIPKNLSPEEQDRLAALALSFRGSTAANGVIFFSRVRGRKFRLLWATGWRTPLAACKRPIYSHPAFIAGQTHFELSEALQRAAHMQPAL